MAFSQIADETSKMPAITDPHFADRKMHGECRAVLALAGDNAPATDDMRFARPFVALDRADMAARSGSGIRILTFWPIASSAV